MRIKWLDAQNENSGLKSIMLSLESDSEAKNQQLKESRAQLIDARAQIASLVSKTQSIEVERLELVCGNLLNIILYILQLINYLK